MDKIVNFPKSSPLTSSMGKPPISIIKSLGPSKGLPKDLETEVEKAKIPFSATLRQLLCCLIFLFAIFCIVMASILIHKYNSKDMSVEKPKSVLRYVKDNLAKEPIVSIQQQVDGETCPKDTTQLEFGKWAGNKSGCKCSDGSIHYKAYCYLIPRTSITCDTVDETESQDIDNLRADTSKKDKYQICAKTLDIDKIKLGDGKACPEKYKACDKNYNFCVETKSDCPLNTFVPYTAAANPDGKTWKLPVKKETGLINNIQVLGKKFMFSQKKSDDAPLIGFAMQEQKPCWESDRQEKFTNKKENKLMVLKPSGCSIYKQNDQTYTDMKVKDKTRQVYGDNGIWDSIKNIPGISDTIDDKQTLELFAERRIDVNGKKKVCKKDSTAVIGKLQDQVHHYRVWVYVLSIIILVLAILTVVIGIVFYFLRRKLKRSPVGFMFFLMILIVICLLIGFIVYLYYAHGDNSIEGNADTYNKIIKGECFQKYESINKALKAMHDFGYTVIDKYGNFWLWFWWVGLILFVITLVMVLYKKKAFKGEPVFSREWSEKATKTADQMLYA